MPEQKYLLALICSGYLTLMGCSLDDSSGDKLIPHYDLLSPCQKPEDDPFGSIIQESLCGTISVFENRASQEGRRIGLNVMVLPSTTAVTKPDPIFLLAGGPGQSAVTAGPSLYSRLNVLRKGRDIVLVDQRGTGESNSLACELDIPFDEQFNLTMAEAMEDQIDLLKKCLETWEADPSLYTTPIAMDDLNEVREVLGFDKINLVGISYGTRAGLVYLRRHEESVRSLVLDAVVPMTLPIPKNVAIDAQSAFSKLLQDCQNQSGCQQAYPDLYDHFQQLVERLTLSPEKVTVHHPRTGETVTGTIDPVLISHLVRNIMYDRTLSRLLPLVIEQAYVGNYQPLSALAYSMTGDESTLSTGMMVSVLCAEDMKLVDSPNKSKDFDNPVYDLAAAACTFWPAGSIPENYFEPVTSSVPVLLTSGTLDPITPPKYGWEAAATLSNSEHIVVPGVGHGSIVTGCMPDVVAEFINKPQPGSINAACSGNLQRPPFFTSFGGVLEPENRADQ